MVSLVLVASVGLLVGVGISSVSTDSEKPTAPPQFDTTITDDDTVELTLSEFNSGLILDHKNNPYERVVPTSELESYTDSTTITISNVEKGDTIEIQNLNHETIFQYNHYPNR